MKLAVFALLAATVVAQHHDPFQGSNCTCETFCNYECSINATKPQNITLYRMTPLGMTDMKNKNTGDIHGDVSFVISRRTVELTCRKDPTNYMCNTVTKFDGDDANNTDLVLDLTIEVDGNWGPYLYCNPVNLSDPTGEWACRVELTSHNGPSPDIHPPPQCSANNFSVYNNVCWDGYPEVDPATTIGECCAAAASKRIERWDFNQGKCNLYRFAFKTKMCSNGTLGYYESHHTQPCNCSRVHQTVGRENLNNNPYGRSMAPAGGEWYSHPLGGMCAQGAHLGENNCTWRVVEVGAIIHARCMYTALDNNVVATDPSCFSACPQPTNRTSDCFLQCYSDAIDRMTPDQLSAPWTKAFQTCPKYTPPANEQKKLIASIF